MSYFGSAFSAIPGELCVKYLEVSIYAEISEYAENAELKLRHYRLRFIGPVRRQIIAT